MFGRPAVFLIRRLSPRAFHCSDRSQQHTLQGGRADKGLAFNPKRPAFDNDADGLLQKSNVIDTVAGMKERRC